MRPATARPVGLVRGSLLSVAMLLTGYVLFLAGGAMSVGQRTALWPLLGLVAVSMAFWLCLTRRDRKLPLFELGGFCMLATVVYAAIPLVWYILSGAEFTQLSHRRLYFLDPTPEQFASIGWMYVAYAAALGSAYLALRDRAPPPVQPTLITPQPQIVVLIVFYCGLQLAFALVSVVYGIQSNTAYDESLYTSYEAYSQLPLAARQFLDYAHAAAVIITCALVTVLASRWKVRLWRAVLLGWLVLSVVNYLISPGSRFLLVSMIVSALVAYDRFVRRIRPAGVFAGLGMLFAAFVVAGALRGGTGGATLASEGSALLERTDDLKVLFTISNEFQISYGSAIELQYLSDHGLLPPTPWQVYASELLLLVPQQFLPFDKVDPVVWYVDATHDPDFFTYGVIAQSMLGLGWFEIVLRGLVVGALFAVIYNWWARAPVSLWRNAFTIWLVVVSYYSVRNTSLYLVTLILMRFVPTVLLVQFLAWLLRVVTSGSRLRQMRRYGTHRVLSLMKILQLIPSLVGGGAERQMAYISIALAGLGNEVHVAYLHGGQNLARLEASGVRLHQIPSSGNHDPMILARLIGVLRKLDPTVVQTWLLQMDVLGGLAARACSKPWILSERSSALMYASHWKFALRRRLGRLARAIVANSDGGLEYWAAVRGPKVRAIIPNAIPFDEIDASGGISESVPGLRDGDPVVLAAGRYSTEKNLFRLIEALNLALARHPHAHAVMFGEGPLLAPLSAAKEGMSCANRMHLLGYTQNLWGWLKRAAVYVSVSRFEGHPNTVLEAIACGCPTVLSDIPAHRAVLSPAATFVPVESTQRIADAVLEVLADGERAKRVAAEAALLLRQSTPERIASCYLDFYKTVIEGN